MRRTVTMRWMMFLVGAVGLTLVAAAAVVIATKDEPGAGVASAAGLGPTRAEAGRPGVRIAHYLGLDITPSRWQVIERPLFAEVNSCMANVKGGPTDPAGPMAIRPAQDLRVADPEAFGRLHGYGVAEDLQARSASRAVPDTSANAGVTESYVANLQACEASAAHIMTAYTAPPVVHGRFGELLAQVATEPAYVKALAAWVACMADAGVKAHSPLSTPESVGERAVTLADKVDASSDETTLVLSEHNLASLLSYEKSVYSTDRRCRVESGVDNLMYDLETKILEQLKSEFPSFRGVAGG